MPDYSINPTRQIPMKPMIWSRRLLALTVPAGTSLLVAPSSAQTWLGTTSTDWATASNWESAIPDPGADIIIADATANGLTLDSSRSIGSFTFGTIGTRTGGFTLQTNAANTLTISGGVIANGGFTAVGPTLRGHFVLPANQTWSVAGQSGAFGDDRGVVIRGVNDNAASVPSGSLELTGNLTKVGSGALMLLGINVTGAGDIIVDEGALKLNAGGNQPLIIGGTGSIIVNNSANLYMARNSGTFDVTRPIVFNGTSGLSAGNGMATTIAAPIAWNGTEHSFNVSVGTGSNTIFTFSAPWTGAATVNKAGNAQATLVGMNENFTGTLNINAGRVDIESEFGGSVFSVAGLGGEGTIHGPLTLTNGSLLLDGISPGRLSTSGDLTLSGTVAVSLLKTPAPGTTIAVLGYGGTLTGGAANLEITGYRDPAFDDSAPGEITLSLGNANRTWNGGDSWDIGGTANWVEGDQFYYQGDAVTFGDTGAGTIALNGALNPHSIVIDSSEDYLFTAAAGNFITGSTGIVKNGTGTATIGGVNTFTGDITVNGGILRPSGNQALGANGRTITIAAGAALDTNGSMNANRGHHAVIAGSGPSGEGAIFNSGANHENGFDSLTLSADATIGGDGRWDVRPIFVGQAKLDLAGHKLTKVGSNRIAFVDGTVLESGTIEINEGTLAFTRSLVEGDGTITVNEDGQLMLENFTSGIFSRPIELNGGTLRNQGATLTLDSHVTLNGDTKISVANGNSLTIANPLTGSGNLEKLDTGAVILTGNHTYTGTTTVSAGVLHLGNGTVSGSINSNPVELGATNAAIRFNSPDDMVFTNVISGTGISGNGQNPSAITKDGPGTLTLTGANTFTGSTRITGGMIAIGSDETVFGSGTGDGSVIDFRTGGNGGIRSSDASPRTIINNISFSESAILGAPGTGKLTFTGNVAFGNGSKTMIVNNDETEFAGVIAGGGTTTALTKNGPGTLIFTGNNTYTQLTVIQQGVLRVGNGGTTGSLGSGAVTNNGSLVFNLAEPEDESPYIVNNVISGSGSLSKRGSGNVILTQENTYTGSTTVTEGILTIDKPFLADSSTLTIASGAKLELFFETESTTDVVAALVIGGESKAPGIYGPVGSGAPNEVAALIGTGRIEVVPSDDPYEAWAAENISDPELRAKHLDADSDGLDNLTEFALDSDPSSGLASGKIVTSITEIGGQPVLTLTLPVREGATFEGSPSLRAIVDGIEYTIEGSEALAAWDLDVDEVTGAEATAVQNSLGLPSLSPGWSYRTFRAPGTVSSGPKRFLRASIEGTP